MWTVIKNVEQYDQAVERMDEIFDSKKGTEEGDELELLLILIGEYDKEHYPIENPDPVAAVEFFIEQRGLTRSQVAVIIGQDKARVSDFLNGKRAVSFGMAKAFYQKLNVPAEIFLGEIVNA